MMARRRTGTTMLVLALSAGPVSAACPQGLAVYGEGQAGAELTFIPPGEGPDPAIGRFTLLFPENGVKLDGVVMTADEPFYRPWGIVMHNCPEGDATGAEIAACTVWEGVVYGIDGEGNVDYLAPAGEGGDAAATLLLPDFGAAVGLSSAWGSKGLSTPPRDDFKMKACQE